MKEIERGREREEKDTQREKGTQGRKRGGEGEEIDRQMGTERYIRKEREKWRCRERKRERLGKRE